MYFTALFYVKYFCKSLVNNNTNTNVNFFVHVHSALMNVNRYNLKMH